MQAAGPRRLAVLALALAVGACQASSDAPLGDRPPPASEVQDLEVAVEGAPFSGDRVPNLALGPAGPSFGIFETLTRLGPGFRVLPGLALRWEAQSPTTWHFFLRKGVEFHDGSPLNAGAVATALRDTAVREGADRPRGLEAGSARALSDEVVEVSLSWPNLRLPDQLANPSLGIAGPARDPVQDQVPFGPNGTGPFRFASYDPGRALRVEANPRYWAGPVRLSSMTFRFAKPGDAADLLAKGQVHVIAQPPNDLVPAQEGGARVVSSPATQAAYLLLNAGGSERWATLQDDNLRRAIAAAIDRDSVTAAAWPLRGEPNVTLVPPIVLGATGARVRAPSRDLATARSLLDQAGWRLSSGGVRVRDGQPLSLSLLLWRPHEQTAAAAALRDQLQRVGVAVEVEEAPDPFTALSRINQGSFDLLLEVRYQGSPDPCSFCRFFTVNPGSFLSFSSYVGAGRAGEELFERAYTEPSFEGAGRHAADLMQVVVGERVLAVPLATLRALWLLSPRVEGFRPSPLPGAQRWDEVWLSR